jgi:glycosyltransferase involved in cell wall biosynthesis
VTATRIGEGSPVTKLSVCIPVYNGAATIERSIESVLAQSYRDFECVVVDNNSTDATVEKVTAFTDQRVRLVRNKTNIGLVGNHNKCVQVARGQLIGFVHSDDWLLPRCLEKLVPAFDAPNVGIAFARRRVETTDASWKARYGRLDGPLQPLSPVNDGRELVRKYLAAGGYGNPIGEPTSVMVRRETLIAAGGFRPEVPGLQDIDAWMRVLSRCDAAFFEEELAVRWHHSGSATDDFAGSATLDKLWVLSDLIHSPELGRAVRVRALGLWLRAFARCPQPIFEAPRVERWAQVRSFTAQARYLAAGRPLRFPVDELA